MCRYTTLWKTISKYENSNLGLSNNIAVLPYCWQNDRTNQTNLIVCVLWPAESREKLKCPPLARVHAWKHLLHSLSSWCEWTGAVGYLTKVWRGLGQSVIDDALVEWDKRLWACICAKGEHFEHLIWFKITHMLMFTSKSIIFIWSFSVSVWSAAVELTTTDCPWFIIDTDSVLRTIDDFSVFQSLRDIITAPLWQFWL